MRGKLNVNDVMRILDISRNTVTAWVKNGTLHGEQEADHPTAPYWFDPQEIENLRLARINELQREINRISKSVHEYMQEYNLLQK